MDTLQQKVAKARTRREADALVKIPIPGYKDESLIGVYGLTDWRTRVEINLRREQAATGERPADILWGIAADHLLASSRTVEFEGEDLGCPLGLELASKFGLNETAGDGNPLASTDHEALALIVDDGEDLIAHFGLLLDRQGRVGGEVDQEIVGESEAAS